MESVMEQESTKMRRPRAARACELCRRKKNRCDELVPCTYCRNRDAECIYRNSDKSRTAVYSTEYVKQLERQVRALSTPEASTSKSGIDRPSMSRDDLLPSLQIGSPLVTSSSVQIPLTQETFNQNTQQGATADLSDVTSLSHDTAHTSTEVMGINRHTKNVEFYGSSSSMALLRRIQMNEHNAVPQEDEDDSEGSLVSQLHNPAFFQSPSKPATRLETFPTNSLSFFHLCRTFLSAFFGSIHYIHPILEKAHFLRRCEDLLSGDSSSQSSSFMALYYSLLSLGALVGQRDEESEDGIKNLDWSRKFFNEARALCGELTMTTDLEMVQCFFFMAKICQNELNPHLSYMYTGLAVRTALAMGINREPLPRSRKSTALLKAESRTWWGLYSLETEMSFAMGRPDTLGVDLYHNRQYPQIHTEVASVEQNPDMIEHPHCAIIKGMVDFSRITRTVCLRFYLSDSPIQRNLTLAHQIELDLDNWLDNLPTNIRPTRTFASSKSLKFVKDAQYMKKQRLVLSIRYHNVRMLLFAPFLKMDASVDRSSAPLYYENIQKCLSSAKETIEIIYETYRHHDFFRTWYYNTTYTLFAVSIILVYLVQEASEAEKQSLYVFVEMSIEILETMDDCIVANKAAKMIRRTLARARESRALETQDQPQDNIMQDIRPLNHYWGPLNFMDGQIDVSFPFEIGDLDDNQCQFGDFGTAGR